jgi:hypothetical protein
MKNNQYPFHYELRFRAIKSDSKNNFEVESFTREFKNNNPLQARYNAFSEFNEFLSFFEIHGRLVKNARGNFAISQPSFIKEIIEKKAIDNFSEQKEQVEHFWEYISVFLVIDDEDLIEKVEDDFGGESIKNELMNKLHEISKGTGIYKSKEYQIHKVASYSLTEDEEQELVDNLEFIELKIFDYFKIETGQKRTEVYHYGEDFYQSGEEGGAHREILVTPHIWQTFEEYEESIKNQPVTKDVDNNFDLEKIIADGESNSLEFKPALVYDFYKKKGSINILYKIAKTICGFLNYKGGLLLIGVSDQGEIQGLEYDYSVLSVDKSNRAKQKDLIRQQVDHLIVRYFNKSIHPLVEAEIKKQQDGKDLLIISIEKSSKPVFLKNERYGKEIKEFYIRMNASTRQISDVEELAGYVLNNWNNQD